MSIKKYDIYHGDIYYFQISQNIENDITKRNFVWALGFRYLNFAKLPPTNMLLIAQNRDN